MNPYIDRQALDELCPEISAILKAECAAGNCIDVARRTGDSAWPKPGTIMVHMTSHFLTKSEPLPDHVKPDGPDYQCGIGFFYQCELHDDLIMEPARP